MKKSPMRRAREAAGLTLEKIAIETGIAFSTIQALESGRGSGYSVEAKEKIAAFLGADFFTLWPEEKERMKLAFKAGMAAARKEAERKGRGVAKK
jgi:transcriptional regulator with XRE-family HTH domain